MFLQTFPIFIYMYFFLNFWFDTVELRSIINVSSYKSKGYTPVVFGCNEFIFLVEMNAAAFCPSLYCVLVIYGAAVSEQ